MAWAFERSLCLRTWTAIGILPMVLAVGCAARDEDCDATANCIVSPVVEEAGPGPAASASSSGSLVHVPAPDGAPGPREAGADAEGGVVREAASPGANIDASDAASSSNPVDVGNCDPDGSPLQGPCISNRYAVFVSTTGDDANDGSRESPLGSLNKALEASIAQSKQLVLVCAGGEPFTAPLELGGRHSGIRIVGGYDCANWTWSGGQTVVKTPRGVIPLRMARAAKLSIRNFQFLAANANDQKDGTSSIASLISESTDIQLANVKLHGGKGADGAPGVSPEPNYLVSLRPDDWRIAGRSAVGYTGGFGQACEDLCRDGAHGSVGLGGQGKDFAPTGGTAGGPRYSTEAACGSGGLPDIDCDILEANGYAGADAPDGPGGLGAATFGTLTASGWTSAAGQNGSNGLPGQGGGGGGGGRMRSPDEPQGGGGSGGCGGCGGTGGLGGKGGGASFALLSFQSDIVLNACELEVSRAGDGGSGSGGQVGQIGGTGAFGSPPGCLGGNGGTGGSGGPGGGGAGGLSVGIGYVGKLPVQAHAPDPVLPSVDTPALGGICRPRRVPCSQRKRRRWCRGSADPRRRASARGGGRRERRSHPCSESFSPQPWGAMASSAPCWTCRRAASSSRHRPQRSVEPV